MNDLVEFVHRIIGKLENAGIPYMVVGSYASGIHGEARSTNDIDLVITCSKTQALDFVRQLDPKEYYVSESTVHEAYAHQTLFNVLDFATGGKADLIPLKDRPFDHEAFRRRSLGPLGGRQVFLQSPEDVILSKLLWDSITPSERQIRDAVGVAVTQKGRLEAAYLHHWARQLAVSEKLEVVLRQASALDF